MKAIESSKATKINLFSIGTPSMRTFHVTWITFFVCFFGWFGIAPLMPLVREELGLTKSQIGSIMIASVLITVVARLIVGWLCDKFGPRITYCFLLLFCSFPVMLIGLSNSYESFLLFRLAIGVIGASFVITQYHTSVMFAPNIVGTANAVTAGWGNLGGGIAQIVIPLIFAGLVGLGYVESSAWRYAMILPGIALLIMAFVYFRFTQDTPDGNIRELRKTNADYKAKKGDSKGSFLKACKNYRVWLLFLVYGSCFGMEITIYNYAALYFHDKFHLSLAQAGFIGGAYGVINLFARPLGGMSGDKFGNKYGFYGRVKILAAFIFMEGLGLILFSQMDLLFFSVVTLVFMALFVQMANGATFAVVPFINKNGIGSVAGIVGAGGNAGAVMAGFILMAEGTSYQQGFLMIGMAVVIISALVLLIKLPKEKSDDIEVEILRQEAVVIENYSQAPILVN